MSKNAFEKIIKLMSTEELTELLGWCSSARGEGKSRIEFIKKINLENALTINSVKNELRIRNERLVEKSKEMVFCAQ
ncbi:TPA: hypothetical protein ACNIQM_001832 [Citrobacter werkmanii]